MILTNGCSFTQGQGLNDPGTQCWPFALHELFNESVENLAEMGKDNVRILEQTINYLVHSKQERVRKPTKVVVQLTDLYRFHVYKRSCSGEFKPDSLKSQFDNGFFTKVNNWNMDHTNTGHAPDGGDYVNFEPSYVTIPCFNPVSKMRMDIKTYITDLSRNYQTFQAIILLNLLCKIVDEMNIKLCVVNYYGIPLEWQRHPLFQDFNNRVFLIRNKNWGLYDTMRHMGYQTTDGYHLEQEAHNWQAMKIKDFFTDSKRVFAEESEYIEDQQPVLDYTDPLYVVKK